MPRKPKVQKHKGVFEREPGSGIWWARYTDADGRRKTRCVGTFGDAKNWIEEQRANVRKGILAPVASLRGVRYSALCDSAIEYSKAEHRDSRGFTARIERTRAVFGDHQAATITPAVITAWFIKERFKSATQNRYRAAMSKAFKLGIENGRVQMNPARLVPQKKEPAGKLRFLSAEEEVRLRAALVERPWALPHLDIALNTGMRRGEQFSLTWADVALDRREIHLSETKNGSSRYVALNSEAMRALRELQAEHERLGIPKGSTLFLSRHNKPIAEAREWFLNACKEAKIEGVTWHTLRHTFCSRLVMAGVDLKTVQDLMGHKTIAMTARYAHLSPDHRLHALEKLVRVA